MGLWRGGAVGLGFATGAGGGRPLWYSARAPFPPPATPAVHLVWPIIDLTEPMAHDCRGAPAASNTRLSVVTSAWSPATVPVPCASISPTVAGEKPALA